MIFPAAPFVVNVFTPDSQNVEKPIVDQPKEEKIPYYEETVVFEGGEEYPIFRIPSLIETPTGALLAFAELADTLAKKGENVLDYLCQLYRLHGLHLTTQQSIALKPGERAGALCDALRAKLPTQVAGLEVDSVWDLLEPGTTPAHMPEPLPASDVLTFYCAGGVRIMIRPSGTEPKVKCYYEICAQMGPEETLESAQSRLQQELVALVERHQGELARLIA